MMPSRAIVAALLALTLSACATIQPLYSGDRVDNYLNENLLPTLMDDFNLYSQTCDLYSADPTAAWQMLDEAANETDNIALDKASVLGWLEMVCNDPVGLVEG